MLTCDADDALAQGHSLTSDDDVHLTCWGNCDCNGIDTITSGLIMHGVDKEAYLAWQDCTWVLAASGDIKLEFTAFDTEGHHDYVSVHRCATFDCAVGDVEQLASLNGSLSNLSSSNFATRAGLRFMRVRFRSNGDVSAAGFNATWTVEPLLQQSVNHSRAQVIPLVVAPADLAMPSSAFAHSNFECNKSFGSLDALTSCAVTEACCTEACRSNVSNAWPEHATISLLQNAGNVTIKGLLSSTTASGFSPETRVKTCVDNSRPWPHFKESLTFDESRHDSPLARTGLEYATDYVEVEDNFYALESHSDSVLSYRLETIDGKQKQRLIDRHSSGQDRLRFTPSSSVLDAAAAQQICTWAKLEVDDEEYVVSGTGCDTQLEPYISMSTTSGDSFSDPTHPQQKSYSGRGSASQVGLGHNVSKELEANALGHWVFRSESLQGPMRGNPLTLDPSQKWVFECRSVQMEL